MLHTVVYSTAPNPGKLVVSPLCSAPQHRSKWPFAPPPRPRPSIQFKNLSIHSSTDRVRILICHQILVKGSKVALTEKQKSNSLFWPSTSASARMRHACVRRDRHFIAIKLATNVGRGTWNGNDHIIRSPASSVTIVTNGNIWL